VHVTEFGCSNSCRIFTYGGDFQDVEGTYLLEINWSGREDLNLRPPGPEIANIQQINNLQFLPAVLQSCKFNPFPARGSHSFTNGSP
jgi:hypothetical protein